MRIDPSNGFSGVSPTAAGAVSGSGHSKAGSKIDVPGGEDSTFTPTPDLARLLAAVKELPDVRTEVVADAAGKLASGDLLTPTAAAETAHAIQAAQVPAE